MLMMHVEMEDINVRRKREMAESKSRIWLRINKCIGMGI